MYDWMYDFFYNYLKARYGPKYEVIYTATDSLLKLKHPDRRYTQRHEGKFMIA